MLFLRQEYMIITVKIRGKQAKQKNQNKFKSSIKPNQDLQESYSTLFTVGYQANYIAEVS